MKIGYTPMTVNASANIRNRAMNIVPECSFASLNARATYPEIIMAIIVNSMNGVRNMLKICCESSGTFPSVIGVNGDSRTSVGVSVVTFGITQVAVSDRPQVEVPDVEFRLFMFREHLA